MPLKKLLLKAGVNQENTRYTNENGWYESQWVRFRQGTPEKIGGWVRLSSNTFLGLCRSLWNWVTLTGQNLLGVGTNLKFYIEQGGAYYDITPIRRTVTLSNPFSTVISTAAVTVHDTNHGATVGDYVTFTSTAAVGGLTISGEYTVTTVIDANSYTITASGNASSTVTYPPGGGGTVTAAYQLQIGLPYSVPLTGWGAGPWSYGGWGIGGTATAALRLWSQSNFGEDLIFAPRGGAIYYWSAASGLLTRGVALDSLGGTITITIASPAVVTLSTALPAGTSVQLGTTGALPTGLSTGTTYYIENVSGLTCNLAATPGGTAINTSGTQSGVQSIATLGDVPTVQNFIYVSDTSRFVFAFGCNDYSSAVQDPMLIRWSDQESATIWYPQSTNQAGSIRLSHGSQIVTAIQTRQEIVVFTDASLYSLQYLGPPVVWGTQLLGDNISIMGPNAVAQASGVVYWMGVDKFYKYDGRVSTLRCDLRQYIYGDINLEQSSQVFASTSEGFNEVWFFYCSMTGPDGTNTPSNPNVIVDRYVVYNYVENNGEGVWYYGNLQRTAWIDSGLRSYPIAATYSYNLVNHEDGVDDGTANNPVPIYTKISSSEFDIDDGDKFGFVWRMLPDITFRGSTADSPTGTLTLIPMQNSGSGYNDPRSAGGQDYASVTRTSKVPIEQFTGQVYIRVRGRQMIMQFENEQLGSQWQLGSPRIDIKTDGRRGNT
jgi:hypothetical protein